MSIAAIKNKMSNFKTGLMMGAVSGMNMMMGLTASASTGGTTGGGGFDSVGAINVNAATPEKAMGAVIGVILTIMRYVGVAMVIYGVYEIVMSIQNNQPEAKTKGIIMALSGVVMIAIKTLLVSFGISL